MGLSTKDVKDDICGNVKKMNLFFFACLVGEVCHEKLGMCCVQQRSRCRTARLGRFESLDFHLQRTALTCGKIRASGFAT